MRTIRRLATGLVLAAAIPMAAEAQSGRHFTDSWFWGAKIGSMVFSTAGNGNESVVAPQIGAEWLITRQRGALYLSFDHAFFDEQATFEDLDGNVHTVEISDSRRFTAAMLAFPVQWGHLRPYGGVGLTMIFLSTARPTDPFATPEEEFMVREEIHDRKDRVALLGMGGLQAQYNRFSIFGQAIAMPGRGNFLLGNGMSWVIEGGIRYNIGSAIERIN